jgi:pimeloyl-ACP methyl ester carboxylesterase
MELAPGRDLERAPGFPVLLFHGDADETIPIEQSRALAERLPNVELRVMPGVGHDELPAAVLDDEDSRQRVLMFLRNQRVR